MDLGLQLLAIKILLFKSYLHVPNIVGNPCISLFILCQRVVSMELDDMAAIRRPTLIATDIGAVATRLLPLSCHR